jgi:phenylpyruvate tautomerase PptA (4-oxalocrotonate tautomerase family)
MRQIRRITMPLLHISLRAGKPAAYRQAIFDGLYRAMRETLDIPQDDQFMTISEHEPANFRTGTGYGVARSDNVVYIQITVFDTRTPEQKKALFRRIAELFGENPGIRPRGRVRPGSHVGQRELVRRQRHRAIRVRLAAGLIPR